MKNKIWKWIYDLHLYDIKGEGLFKTILITFSWVGGVKMNSLEGNITVSVATNLFLFSIALIMEYAVKLVMTETFLTKLLPSLIIFLNCICVIATFAELVDKSFGIKFECLYNMTIASQVIIWVDVIAQLIIPQPVGQKIETLLKGI